jgi:signal transduction histidine kinase
VARGRKALRHYIRSLPDLIFYEGSPLILAPLMALIYTRLCVAMFLLFALSMVVASLITRSLDRTSQRLKRRVQELRGLQAVGQALSASLDIEAVVSAIYEQVARLMPARNFYVSLCDPQIDEVSFPLAVEEGERVRWRSRRTGSGLTEYVLRSREPLLIRGDVEAALKELGVTSIGRPAACWLGVPILAADEVLGVIAIQSYETADAYDASHQRVLTTIAAQAAVAIQNARLYARTDEALARRVQELDSILRTTGEGLLLLDTDWRVVAANPALANLLGVTQLELVGQVLDVPHGEGIPPLIGLLGYEEQDLRADCQSLESAKENGGDVLAPQAGVKQAVVTLDASGRHVERTLTPVRSREETITGWLFVLRDVTEEIELARLKEDMTYMLVHDLRSPLTVLGNSFTLMEEAFAERDSGLFETFVSMAHRSCDRMLDLINGLLDVSELESDELELNCEAIDARALLLETVKQFSPLAASAEIRIEVFVPEGLPPLYVDGGLIRRVLHNLVDNAMKFAPDGSRIRVWARPDHGSAQRHLLVGVSDEGPGIPAEEQHKLFEKFHRVSSVKGRRAGSGLGLPFCKLAVEAHGGRIWVESPSSEMASSEAGSTFLMTLPAAPSDGLTDPSPA